MGVRGVGTVLARGRSFQRVVAPQGRADRVVVPAIFRGRGYSGSLLGEAGAERVMVQIGVGAANGWDSEVIVKPSCS